MIVLETKFDKKEDMLRNQNIEELQNNSQYYFQSDMYADNVDKIIV